MIPTPPGWRRVDVGDDVILLPIGEPVGVVRYRERLHPVLSVEALVAGQLADDPQFQVVRIEPAIPLVTFEGERAAALAVIGTLGEQSVERYFGYVLTDDFYARVSVLSIAPAHHERLRALTRDLVVRVSLRLGARRRRPLYDAPIGWRAHSVGLRTDWITSEFPLDPSCLTVWPAVPGLPPTTPPPIEPGPGVMGPWPVHTRHGLHGFTWRTEGQFADQTPRRRDFVLLADGRYRYSLRLEATPARHEVCRSELLGVIESLIPVPSDQRPATATNVIEHWAE